MPKINIAAVPKRKGSGYPPPFDFATSDADAEAESWR